MTSVEPRADSVAAEYRALIEAWADALGSGDIDRAIGYLAPDYVGHVTAMPQPVQGPEAFRGMFMAFIRPAFPDQKITIERQVVHDDRIAVQMSWTATHLGPFLNIPPTSRRIQVSGTGIFRIRDGRIAEEWMLEDFLGIYQQLTQG